MTGCFWSLYQIGSDDRLSDISLLGGEQVGDRGEAVLTTIEYHNPAWLKLILDAGLAHKQGLFGECRLVD